LNVPKSILKIEKPQTLGKLNQLFWVWLEECYQNKAHSSLEKNLSPEATYRSDQKPLRFLELEVVANAFLHCEARKVDKVGCISSAGKKYEVGLSFIGCTVDVIYDPTDISELTIEYEGHAPSKAKPLVIGEREGQRPKMPEHLTSVPAESSRLLGVAAKRNQQRQAPAISYRALNKGVNKHV
jgi:putative transposase